MLDHPTKSYFKRLEWRVWQGISQNTSTQKKFNQPMIWIHKKLICSSIILPIINYNAPYALSITNRVPFSHSILYKKSPQSHFVTSIYLIKHLVFHPPNNKMFQYHLLLSHLHHSFFNSPSCYEPINHHLPQACQQRNFNHWAYQHTNNFTVTQNDKLPCLFAQVYGPLPLLASQHEDSNH